MRTRWLLLALGMGLAGPGCAALTNPLADGIPVRTAPPEMVPTTCRDAAQTVPLTLLRQPAAEVERLDTGDVLGVWVEGILGERNTRVPVHVLAYPAGRDQRSLPPSMGYPFTVRPDGTIPLPLVEPVAVRGLSIAEAEQAVRQAYLKKDLLPPGRERLSVTLVQRRQYAVVVLRQEGTSFSVGAEGATATAGKRGAGFVMNLAAGENDVLHALAATGGLPGLDVYNEVVIFRRLAPEPVDRQLLLQEMAKLPPGTPPPPGLIGTAPVVRIPLRLPPGQPLPIHPEDVVLYDGDVVYLEARDRDIYYTAGLLPAGEHVLPRDRDLDVLSAVALVRGPLVNSTFGTNTLSGAMFPAGLGQPSASLLVVLRKTAKGQQVPIRIDLNQALRDSRERIVVQAGDLLVLQEKPSEALTRYMSQTLTNFNLIWAPIHGPHETGIFDLFAPDRLPGRGLYSTIRPGLNQ